jgi:hypothetical protein
MDESTEGAAIDKVKRWHMTGNGAANRTWVCRAQTRAKPREISLAVDSLAFYHVDPSLNQDGIHWTTG